MFLLDDQRYALRLDAVDRVYPRAAITPLPQAPEVVLGIVDVRGTVVPAVDLRRRFGLPEREERLSDQFILARTNRRRLVLVADDVLGVVELPPGAVVPSGDVVPGLAHVKGVARQPDGLVLIHDLDTFLSLDEEAALDAALDPSPSVRP